MDAILLPRRFAFIERVSRRVVLAHDLLTDQQVALKATQFVTGAGLPGGDGALELAREAEVIAGLAHPGFPRLIDFGFLTDGRAFFAMERAEGERPAGPLESTELAALIDGACEALSLLHSRGLLHRDLKPDNVRFDPATGRVMLIDLGLATPPGRVRDARGTRGYLAPELLERGCLDARSDLYALGALVYECATGRPAFSGEDSEILIDQRAGRFVPLRRLRPDLDDAFASEIARLLDPVPGRRPATADEARGALLATLGPAGAARASLGTGSAGGRSLCAEHVGALADRAALERVADSAAASGESRRVVISGVEGSGRSRLLEEWRCCLALSARPMLVRHVTETGPHPLAELREDLELLLDMDLPVAGGVNAVGGAVAAAAWASAAVAALAASAWRRAPLVLAFECGERIAPSVAEELAAFARATRGSIVVVLTTGPVVGVLEPRAADIALRLGPLPEARALQLAASAIRGEVSSELRHLVLAGDRAPGKILATLERVGLGRCPPSPRSTTSTPDAATSSEDAASAAGAGPGHAEPSEPAVERADLGAARIEARKSLAHARRLARRGDVAAADAFVVAAHALEDAELLAQVPAALADCARWRESTGDLQGALEAWTECLDAADALGETRGVAAARDALAALHSRAGHPADAADHARAAAQAWANVHGASESDAVGGSDEGREARSQSLLAAGRNALRAGQVNAAVAELQHASRLASPSTPRERRAELLSEVGIAQLAAAEHAEALACFEEALTLATEARDRIGQAKASCALGLVHGAFGSTREGVRWCRRALELTESMPGSTRARARLELGTLFVREGHLAVAERALRQALAESQAADDLATASRACLRLGRVQRLTGERAQVDATLRQGLDIARSIGDRLAEIEALREMGVNACELGDSAPGLALIEESLEAAVGAGCYAELPATHEALARAHLRLALRLRTPTGVVVDRERIAIARAHLEKGLDLTVTTGRMADRAALLVLDAAVSEMTGDASAALATADEAHRLALETGDLLVASRARLVRGEALLASREFGVALAEARIALEAVSRSGATDDEWRAHALLSRVQGAWGMPEREAASTAVAAQILRKIAGTLSTATAGAFLADAERQSALVASGGDAVRARRQCATELVSERLGGRVDTEDLVEALITARRLAEDRGMALDRARARLRRTDLRRRVLARAAHGAETGPRDAARVLAGLARAWCAESAVLAVVENGVARICATHGQASAEAQATLQRLVDADSGADAPASRIARCGRAGARAGVDGEMALPLKLDSRVVGALFLRLRQPAAPISRADRALLEALSPLLALIVTSSVNAIEPAGATILS